MKLKKLYKRASKGKVTTFQVEIEGNKFRSITGFIVGKQVIGSWTECFAKSYNTNEEQCLKQAKALHKKKSDKGAFENIEDIDSKSFIDPMLATQSKKVKIPYGKKRVFAQPKLDGLRDINYENKQQTRTGKYYVSVPHLNQDKVMLDGEIYNHKLRSDFGKIASLGRKQTPTIEEIAETAKMAEYWVYDMPQVEGVFSVR